MLGAILRTNLFVIHQLLARLSLMDVKITLTVNGITKRIITNPERSILDVLREDLQGTGSGHRCGEGRCGGCVILLDNQRVLSCDTPIIKADQRTITTIED